MQDMNPEACSQAPLNTQKMLTDTRDGNTYTVARIQNKTNTTALCWMTQNLRLVGGKIITPEDSDVAQDFFLTGSSVLSNDTPKQFSPDDQYQSRVYYTYTDTSRSYGAYYNWYTATAGTGNADFKNGNAPSSICPKGWRLPTGGDDGEFYNLLDGFTKGSEISVAPYKFVLAGSVGGNSTNNVSNTGFYWTSTSFPNINTSAYAMYFYTTSSLTLSSGHARYSGFSVRCVAR